MTGRTDIWGYVIPDIYQRPLLGWGYQAFWSTDNPAAWAISNALHWWVPQAHNGMLEILLSVGLIGAVWFIYLWGRTVRLSLECMETSESAMAITCLSMCAGAVLVGVSEFGPPLYWFHNFHLLHYWFLLRASDINSTTANLQASC